MKMIELFTEEEFENAKYNDLLTLECNYCHLPFKLERRWVKFNRKRKETKGFYGGILCSQRCFHKFNSQKIEVKCAQCNKILAKRPGDLNHPNKKSERCFCGHSCAGLYNSTHKKYGTKVSKLEKWISNKLPAIFTEMAFVFNGKQAIDSELDIYIPSLKLAFELNGVFHYEPIFGQARLDGIKNNDQRKFAACHQKGISLCIIDVSNMKYFKESAANRYLDIIVSIIKRHSLNNGSG